jgi:hypothetical protein
MTRDQTPAQNTISLGKFAKRIASAVGRFLDVSPFFSFGFSGNLAVIFDDVVIGVGSPSTAQSKAKLAGRRQRGDHQRTGHPDWGRTRHAGELAAHPPAQSFCSSAMPAAPRIVVVGS